ncbi:MAG: hypothetical protein ABWY54_00580 [Glaciihabitans sp.]
MSCIEDRSVKRIGTKPRVSIVPPTVGWSSPETNLWVANRDGEYAGMVELVDELFLARDSTGHVLGTENSLVAAKLLVRSNLEADTGVVGAVQAQLQRASDAVTATLAKPDPHYSRSV